MDTDRTFRVVARDAGEWDAFRCRSCQKLLFKATKELIHGMHRRQQLEIKCQGCKTMNYLAGSM